LGIGLKKATTITDDKLSLRQSRFLQSFDRKEKKTFFANVNFGLREKS